jgi:hypothetical protein
VLARDFAAAACCSLLSPGSWPREGMGERERASEWERERERHQFSTSASTRVQYQGEWGQLRRTIAMQPASVGHDRRAQPPI